MENIDRLVKNIDRLRSANKTIRSHQKSWEHGFLIRIDAAGNRTSVSEDCAGYIRINPYNLDYDERHEFEEERLAFLKKTYVKKYIEEEHKNCPIENCNLDDCLRVECPRPSSRIGRISQIPTEFYNHQLMDIDSSCENSIFDAMSKWGPIFSPERSIKRTKSIKETERLTKSTGFELGGTTISLLEAQDAITCLQKSALSLFSVLREPEDISHAIEWETADLLLRAGAGYNRIHIHHLYLNNPVNTDIRKNIGSTSGGFLGLTTAICHQIFDSIEDTSADWKVCALERCDRIFKHQQRRLFDPNRKPSDKVLCCSEKHADTAKKRRQRGL